MYYRHGDLGISKVTTLPQGAKKIYHGNEFVLAWGEVTGHKHLMFDPETQESITVLEDEGTRYLDLKKPVKIRHEEHKTITVEKGLYIVKHEREWDYIENDMRKVVD